MIDAFKIFGNEEKVHKCKKLCISTSSTLFIATTKNIILSN